MKFIQNGGSKAEAAHRFELARSSVYRYLTAAKKREACRRKLVGAPGALPPSPQGKRVAPLVFQDRGTTEVVAADFEQVLVPELPVGSKRGDELRLQSQNFSFKDTFQHRHLRSFCLTSSGRVK